ncbi:DUF6794 domain-containing protein [Flagellimonas beolgyonensis]|uniref:DUF6794 domain-containing protein n=1 Tax=Flagellimonas beolgyonensis TaxID=864064 RepID=UPI000F8C7D88|nr:DUF6794 domain-containing protein [Allomuricauda beolgyonensis]
MMRRFILMVLLLSFIGCQNKDTPLYTAIESIEKSWSTEELKDFAQKPDSIALLDEHFDKAMVFRNQELHSPNDSTLLNYFHSLGIYHEDYMSSIVFASLHKKLNGKPIDIDAQIANIHSIMADEKQRNDKNISRANGYFSKYNVGDTIVIRMPIEKGSAYSHNYPQESNWVYNDSLDLLVIGQILSKHEENDISDKSFEIKVLSKNKDSVKILMEEIHVGDEMKVNLLRNIIENVD